MYVLHCRCGGWKWGSGRVIGGRCSSIFKSLIWAGFVFAAGIGLSGQPVVVIAANLQDIGQTAIGDQEQKPPTVVIADQPRTIDPAQFLPEALTKKVTVELRSSSVAELVEWLQDHCGLTVLIQYAELADEHIHESDPVSDGLTDEPVYLLLDRLERLGMGWYFEGDVLYLTTRKTVAGRQVTTPYF